MPSLSNHEVDDAPLQMGRREKKRQAVRQSLLDAGRSIIEEVGFKAATIQQIADRADVSLGTFFNYMETKEQLLREIIAEQLAQAIPEDHQPNTLQCAQDLVACNLDAQLKAYVAVRPLLQLGLLHAGAFSPLDLHHPTSQAAMRRERRTRQIANLQQDGKIRADIPAHILSQHFDLITSAAVAAWLLNDDSDLAPLKSGLEQAISLFLHGIEIGELKTA